MNLMNVLGLVYVVSIAYCVWRLVKRYNKSSHDGVTGPTPGMDIFGIVFLAPILMVVDIITTWIIMIRRYYKNKYGE